MSAVLTDARVAQRWSTTLPRWGSRVRSPSRASFFAFFYMTGMDPARGFGLRSAPVGAKRVPLARGAPSRAHRKKVALICVRKRSAIGEKVWYFFHTRYSFVSRLGESGRNANPLPGVVSTSLSKVSRYPRCSFAKIDALYASRKEPSR